MFAGLRKGHSMQTITLEEALELFRFPRNLGTYENKDVVVGIGRFGPFIRHNNKFISIPKSQDPGSINADEAIALIEEKRKQEREKTIKVFAEKEDVIILNGRFGPYISYEGKNIRIPKGTDPASLSLEDCKKMAEEAAKKPSRRPVRKKS